MYSRLYIYFYLPTTTRLAKSLRNNVEVALDVLDALSLSQTYTATALRPLPDQNSKRS